MRERMVRRYYCDFCKKAGCSKGHMVKHERRCTANPNRVCGMCALGAIKSAPLDELIKLACEPGTEADDVLGAAKGCPACALSAIRQSSRAVSADPESMANAIAFDYKKASRDFLDDLNEKQARQDHYGY